MNEGRLVLVRHGVTDWNEDGRLMVAINHNVDMGDAWEHADDAHYPAPMTATAYRFGINYLIYYQYRKCSYFRIQLGHRKY